MKMHLARRTRRLKLVAASDGAFKAITHLIKWLARAAWFRLHFLWFFFLTDKRGLAILFLKNKHTRPVPEGFSVYGNYVLASDRLDPDAIVYSFGIGQNITFDRAVSERFGCKVFAFDPTPLAIRYMADQPDENIVFTPAGLWTEDSVMQFSLIRSDEGEIASGSITNIHGFKNAETFSADVRCLKSIMEEHGHKTVDLLKLDIEGAGLPVIQQALEQGIFPRQIVAEFEVPVGAGLAFLRELNELLVALKREGYDLYSLPSRLVNINFSIELIALRHESAIQ